MGGLREVRPTRLTTFKCFSGNGGDSNEPCARQFTTKTGKTGDTGKLIDQDQEQHSPKQED